MQATCFVKSIQPYRLLRVFLSELKVVDSDEIRCSKHCESLHGFWRIGPYLLQFLVM